MKNNQSKRVLFDGECILCNRSVRFIIRHDKQARIRFSAMRSDQVKQLLPGYKPPDSLIYIRGRKYYVKSSAVLRIAKDLDGWWPILYIFAIIPPFIRDFFYDLIAKRRYKLFGRNDRCMIPEPNIINRFDDFSESLSDYTRKLF